MQNIQLNGCMYALENAAASLFEVSYWVTFFKTDLKYKLLPLFRVVMLK